MKLPGGTKNKITKSKNGQTGPHLEINEVVLAHCNIVNNDYQEDSRVLFIFILVNISPKYFIFFKNFNLEFSCLEVKFTDQTSKLLEIEDKINTTLVIN